MPTQALSIGYPINMLQNIIYATPARQCFMFSEVAAATFEMSDTVGFALAIPVTLDTNKQAAITGSFIRCTSGNVNVTFKAA